MVDAMEVVCLAVKQAKVAVVEMVETQVVFLGMAETLAETKVKEIMVEEEDMTQRDRRTDGRIP